VFFHDDFGITILPIESIKDLLIGRTRDRDLDLDLDLDQKVVDEKKAGICQTHRIATNPW
jgi:hypothetical protein